MRDFMLFAYIAAYQQRLDMYCKCVFWKLNLVITNASELITWDMDAVGNGI